MKLTETNQMQDLERRLTAWETELSKVMPLDFKDWWENSKEEWPIIARMVIESKTEQLDSADKINARIEAVINAARCIDGMIVSAEHVHKLWDALIDLDDTNEQP